MTRRWRHAEFLDRFAPCALLAIRVTAAVLVARSAPEVLSNFDGEDYWRLTRAISSGNGFSSTVTRSFEAPRTVAVPEAFRPPLLPFLGAWLLRGHSASPAWLLAFQALLATLATAALFMLLGRIAGRRAAWAGALLFTLHPLFLFYSFCYSSEILFTLCLTGFVGAWVSSARGKWAALGGTIAFATLARPTGLLLLPLSAVALLPRGRGTAKAIALITAGFLLVTSPWLVRNYRLFGDARPTSFFGGYNFWVGNSCDSLASYRAATGREFLRLQGKAVDEATRLAGTLRDPRYADPKEQEAFWVRQAWQEIRRCGGIPGWLELLALKTWAFWRPWPVAAAHAPVLFWLVAVSEVTLFAAGIAGLHMLYSTRPDSLVPLGIVLAAGTISHALTIVNLRYRVPFVDLVMLVGAATRLGGLADDPRLGSAPDR